MKEAIVLNVNLTHNSEMKGEIIININLTQKK
jgi:hypothetical protein